jgi:hypothetical protein
MTTFSVPAEPPALARPDIIHPNADPPLLSQADAFSPDALLFSPPGEDYWSLSLSDWIGQDQPFGNAGLERGIESIHTHDSQQKLPTHEENEISASLGTIPWGPLDRSPEELDGPQRAGSHDNCKGKSNGGGHKRRKSSKHSSTGSEGQGEDDASKRERYLERNRIAASKCRQRKKEQNKGLEYRFKEQSEKNDALMAEFARLRLEVVSLKSKVLEHSKCGDKSIGRHLEQSAMTLAQNDPPDPDLTNSADSASWPETSISLGARVSLSLGASDQLLSV